MAYVVVEFNDDSEGLAVTCAKWLTSMKNEIFWPPYKEQHGYNKSLRNQESPNTEHWKLYPLRRIFYQSDDLEKAILKQKRTEFTSNLDSDEEVQSKRITKAPKRFQSDSDEDTPRSNHIKRPPRLNLSRFKLINTISDAQSSGTFSSPNVQTPLEFHNECTNPEQTESIVNHNDMSYEKEQERLQKLWELVQAEDIVNTIPDNDEDLDEEDCVEERIEDSESEQELEVEIVEDIQIQIFKLEQKKENIMTLFLLAKKN
ncbi:hypothetical protein FQR65_LT15805 [Abscondita terminalis]|nr:hypothetical protein FQR65_LT15805 [Abscondita terminalis]